VDTVLQSRSRTVTIAIDKPFCIIGERINPTGRKAFAAELREGNLDRVIEDADAQIAMGCDMLDVNAGIPLVDEAELLAQMIRLLQDHTDTPLCIDSSVIEALEAGLDAYEGKALVSSVTGEDERLEVILPIVAKHGAAVIGLTNDETGIPETALMKCADCPARRSKFGVFTFGSPVKPNACGRHWSAMTMTMFGGAAAKAAPVNA